MSLGQETQLRVVGTLSVSLYSYGPTGNYKPIVNYLLSHVDSSW